jgi:hypothetical protein
MYFFSELPHREETFGVGVRFLSNRPFPRRIGNNAMRGACRIENKSASYIGGVL